MQQIFTAAPHHDILVFLVQLAVLLLSARLLGEVAQRLGQPTVVGEILAGILLGPSFLSGLVPFVNEWMIPHNATQGYLLEMVGLLGVMFLLLITGLETDIALMKRHSRSAIGSSLGGLMVSLSVGFLVGQVLPTSLLVSEDQRFEFSLFLAVAMSISAIPVIAKVLMDLKLTRRDVGQTIIASAMIDDTTGWILLSVVIGLVERGSISVIGIVQSIGSVLLLIVLSFTVGRWLVRRSIGTTLNRIQGRDKMLTLMVCLMFLWAAVSQGLNLEALLGAFMMGIVMSLMPNLDSDAIHKVESVTFGIFSPIFFAIAGLKVNIAQLLKPELILVTVLFIVMATICKVVGVYLGARFIGRRQHWPAVFFGMGLNARGSMGIIIANIGLTLGILTQDMFSIIVMMAIATSLVAPFGLRWALRHIQPEEQELERLRQEEMNRDNIIANVHRVLLPARRRPSANGNPVQFIEARILERIAAKTDLSITLFNVATEGEDRASAEFLDNLSRQFSGQNLSRKIARGTDAEKLILDEANRGYDLLVIGATDKRPDSTSLFTPLVDELLRLAPCPTIIVRGGDVPQDWKPQRILVPTNGTMAARRAAEVAFGLAVEGNEEVFILNVVPKSEAGNPSDVSHTLNERRLEMSRKFTETITEMGRAQAIQTFPQVQVGSRVERVILDTATEHNVDLIVLGTSLRAADRLYLGPRVERILYTAPCPVIIVNSI